MHWLVIIIGTLILSISISNPFYKLIIGPIENEVANKLVSTFILKGYKENEIILEYPPLKT